MQINYLIIFQFQYPKDTYWDLEFLPAQTINLLNILTDHCEAGNYVQWLSYYAFPPPWKDYDPNNYILIMLIMLMMMKMENEKKEQLPFTGHLVTGEIPIALLACTNFDFEIKWSTKICLPHLFFLPLR